MWSSSLFLTTMYLSGTLPPTLPSTLPLSWSSLNILTLGWSITWKWLLYFFCIGSLPQNLTIFGHKVPLKISPFAYLTWVTATHERLLPRAESDHATPGRRTSNEIVSMPVIGQVLSILETHLFVNSSLPWLEYERQTPRSWAK